MTEHPVYLGKAGIKGLGLFSIFILEKPLKEVCLIKVQKQIGEQQSTIRTNWNTNRLLKRPCTKQDKYVVDQTILHLNDFVLFIFIIRF